jgi:predicted NBD/HSP70 family sugar kinase
MKILVIDVGGSSVKCVASDHQGPVQVKSGKKLTPDAMVKKILKRTEGWRYDAVSIGYPGAVRKGKIERDPHNLGTGWIGYDFEAAFKCPVRIVNDAAMQALGGYDKGTMLFLGLGTGLGSALIVDDMIVPLELAHLPYLDGRSYEEHLGQDSRKRLGNSRWRTAVWEVVEALRKAFLPDEVLIGGGNVNNLKKLPPQTRRGDNADAFAGGFRLWPKPKAASKKRPK